VELGSDVVARNSLLSVVSSPNLPLRHLPPGTPGHVVLAGAREAPILVSGDQSGRLVVMDDVLEQIGGDGIDNLAPDGVVDAVLVPGGATLFVGSRNGDIVRYDRTPTGWQERLVFEGAGTVLDMAIEPATAALAVSYSRGTVVTLAPTTAEPQEWACAPSPTALAFESPGVLIAGDAEGRLYRFELGEPVDGCLVTAPGADRPGAAVIAIVREQASGDWLVARRATVVERYGPQLGRAQGGDIRVGGPTLLTSISVDQGGNEVALGTADGVVRFVALDTGEETRPPIRGHDAEVSALAQAGEHVVSAGSDGSIVVWPARSASRLATELFARPGEEVRGLAVAEASGTLVAGRQDGTVLGWDDVSRPWASLSVGQSPSSIRALDITADASRIAVGQADGRVTVLQRAGDGTFALVAQTLADTLPSGEVKALAFTPDGTGLVSGHESGLVEVRSLPHLELLHSLSNPETTVRAIAMTEAAFYIGWLNGEIEGWSTGPRTDMVWQGKADDSLESLAVMEGHNVLVSGHESGVVEFRSISDRNVEDRFQGVHRSPVRSIAVHEGGPYLATAERNGRIVLWDARRRERFPTPLDGHTDDLRNITFAPDGLALFSAGYDGRVLRWELDLERWKHLACRSAGRPMTDHERSRFSLEDNGDERACA
jgi:WD40 repeat protein